MRLHWRTPRTAWILRIPERYAENPAAVMELLADRPRRIPVSDWLGRGLLLRPDQPVSFAVLTSLQPVQTAHYGILWRFAVDPYLITVSSASP